MTAGIGAATASIVPKAPARVAPEGHIQEDPGDRPPPAGPPPQGQNENRTPVYAERGEPGYRTRELAVATLSTLSVAM